MPPIRLSRLLRKETGALIQNLAAALAADWAASPALGIQDAEGAWLLGQEPADPALARRPILLEGDALGWVVGPERAAAVLADLLTHLAEREFEKRTLSQETLERYKEINLLYSIAGKMAACLDAQSIAELVINEACKLIVATSASIMLLNQERNRLEMLAASGTAAATSFTLDPGQGIAGNVLVTGKGVIINDVTVSPEFVEGPVPIMSIMSIPLKVEDNIIGVMNISHETPVTYTAGDLKLATALATQAAVSIENARLQAERLESERMVKELEIARTIQESLLPQSMPEIPGAEVSALFLPARQVGGDFYDCIPMTDDRLGVVMADVSGKGVPAALFMALSRALMRANSLNDPGVAEAVIRTNRLILDCTSAGLFVTLFYAIIDPRQRALRYVSAGHNPPLLYKPRTGETLWLEADGIALGVLDEIELEEKSCDLEPGDVIVLYTDGVTEATNLQDEIWGEEQLEHLVIAARDLPAGDLAAGIRDAAMAFAGDAPQFDDFTLMVVKMQ
jgi:phosphoserine phosphatase RsbU/P